MPSKKETLTVIVIMALFLLLTAACIGLRSEHLLMAALYLVLFFAGLPTRKLAVALLIILSLSGRLGNGEVLLQILSDSMRPQFFLGDTAIF